MLTICRTWAGPGRDQQGGPDGDRSGAERAGDQQGGPDRDQSPKQARQKGSAHKNPRGACCRDAGPDGTGRTALGPAGWSRWEPKQERPETLDQSRQILAHVPEGLGTTFLHRSQNRSDRKKTKKVHPVVRLAGQLGSKFFFSCSWVTKCNTASTHTERHHCNNCKDHSSEESGGRPGKTARP